MKLIKTTFVLLVAAAACLASNASAAVCNANPDRANVSITACLAQATSGDVIRVDPGIYTDASNGGYEVFPLQMKPGITLVGSGPNTLIDAPAGHAIVGDSSGVRIENLAVKAKDRAINFTTMATPDGVVFKDASFLSTAYGWSGIHVENNSESVTIDNCTVTGQDWVITLSPGSMSSIKEVKIIDSTLIDNSNGAGEAAIQMINVEKLIIRNVDVRGWPYDTGNISAGDVYINNLKTSDNSTIYFGHMPGYYCEVLIRDSILGYNTAQSTHFRGNAAYAVINSQLNLPVSSDPQIELKLTNCYTKGGGAIPNL